MNITLGVMPKEVGDLTLLHPLKNGIITNWEDMQAVWRHCFAN